MLSRMLRRKNKKMLLVATMMKMVRAILCFQSLGKRLIKRLAPSSPSKRKKSDRNLLEGQKDA